VIILNTKTGSYYSIEGTGILVWDMINGKTTVSAIIKELLKKVDASEKVLVRDIPRFLDSLVKEEIISVK